MAFTVRIYGLPGVTRIPLFQDGGTAAQDSIHVKYEPYLWRQALVSNGTTSVASTVAGIPANHTIDPTKCLRVEVADGQSIRYEVNFSGVATTADTNSPLLTGRDLISFGPNAIFSFIDASGT